MHTREDIETLQGQTLYAGDDSKIGEITDIYTDRATGAPEWLAVKTGMFGTNVVDADGELSPEEERRLYEHYSMDFGDFDYERENGTLGHDTSGPNTDQAVTRSEEEIRVATAQVETGRARLRKYVTTEQVQTSVPVAREEVRIEREPISEADIDSAMDCPAISEEEHEVTLYAEEPVVEKRVVPRERVRLDKHTIAEEREVSEEVRKEQIEAEDGR